ADFRDLWAENHSYQMPAWRRAIDHRWERLMLRNADAFTSPTEAWAEQLSRQHGKPGACVPNGYVDYEADATPAPAASRQFTLLYTGVRYPNNQEILPLLEAIAALQAEHLIDQASFQFRWIGPFDADTARLAAELGITPLISQESSVGRREAQLAQAAAQAVLFLQWQDAATDWSSSLKLHEYVGCGRPILALGGHPDSKVSALLQATGRAAVTFTAAEVAATIKQWMADLRLRGAIHVPDDWRTSARALSGISRGIEKLHALIAPLDTLSQR
ncbi:MAG: hypothetical protein NTU67_08700, partial [Gemmatimonadetes bacterium]|nr:hypothetical protein [Gemmatimonadota bacterium]